MPCLAAFQQKRLGAVFLTIPLKQITLNPKIQQLCQNKF